MLIPKRGAMMQTCRDVNNGNIIDISRLTPAELDQLHYAKRRKQLGVGPVCKGCNHPVNLTHHQSGAWFWRHNPGATAECSQIEFNHSESPEHLQGKLLISSALGGLTGWQVEAERFASHDGIDVFVDVFAERTQAGRHALQVDTAFEVQLSPQTTGDFVGRTEAIRQVTGARPVWATPHRAALGSTCGLIIDGSAAMVVDQAYAHVDQETPLTSIPLGTMVKGIWGSRPKYEFAQSGDITSSDPRALAPWIVWTKGQGKPRLVPRRRTDPTEPFDRDCDRPEATATVSAISPGVFVGPSPLREWPQYTMEWTAGLWEGRSRMAAARQHADITLNDVDEEALRLFPSPASSTSV